MIARVATFHTEPQDDRDWVIDALRGVPGVHGAYHLRDEATGSVLSISFFDREEGERAAYDAISARAQEIRHQGTPPDEIRLYEVVRFVENR